jgi:hypothetical protein
VVAELRETWGRQLAVGPEPIEVMTERVFADGQEIASRAWAEPGNGPQRLGDVLKAVVSTSRELWEQRTGRSFDEDPVCERCGVEHDEVSCCACLDAGFVLGPLEAVGVPRRREPCGACQGPEPVTAYLQRAGVDVDQIGYTLASWGRGKPRDRAEAYMATWPPSLPWLVLEGQVGRGKTGLAVGVMREAYERYGVRGRFHNVVDLLDRIKATYGRGTEEGETTAQVHHALVECPLLVIDDLGAQYGTEWAASELYGVLERRHRKRMPTVITTNLTISEFDPRIKSRMLSTQHAVVVSVGGSDRRVAG